MARVNKCWKCKDTEPKSGWAGTNHSLCKDCARQIEGVRNGMRTQVEAEKRFIEGCFAGFSGAL